MRFVIIGGGPAGNQAATHAARLGVDVTLIERDVVGGAANLWDCIPSKAMIATGGAMSYLRRVAGMGVIGAEGVIDLDLLRQRISTIVTRLEHTNESILESQQVRVVRGTAHLVDANTVVAETPTGEEVFATDAILLSTGSRPRVPDWAQLDKDRILSTRDAYPPNELPSHLVVIGSGVTGVEFVHLFSSFGSEVTLIVSRQQVLPHKDPEVAAVLEADFSRRGVHLLKGARAIGVDRTDDGVTVSCADGRIVHGSHALLAVGSVPNSEGLGLEAAGIATDAGGYVPINRHCQTNVPHIFAAGDLSGKLPLSSVAAMQGLKVAEYVVGGHTVAHHHPNYDSAPSAIFTEPEIADVGLAEADAFAEGRKIRVTKVPFAASARALIDNDSRGFVKIITDPATGVVLGGSIVGENASELISVIALAVTGKMRVTDLVESMPVHPTLAEALAEAAE
jgi:pyruvate/2-oxoglutarate dehydrogenase complex dihydrolipoamide dehydrogenase (E3) component